jgi:ABC-type nitrate/sulfonate/bicarbonate transport system permease component
MKPIRHIGNAAVKIWLPAVLIAAWWASSSGSSSFLWPPLGKILSAFRQDWIFARVSQDLVPSLRNLILGLVAAVVLGVLVGMLLGSVSILWQIVRPLFEFIRACPPVSLIPPSIAVFGSAYSGKIALIALSASWPIILNTIDGVRSVEPSLRDLAGVFRFPTVARMRLIVLPSAMPSIMVGIRQAVSIGVIIMVGSEMFASTQGVGYHLVLSQQTFNVPQTWAATILLGLIGYAANFLVRLLESVVLRWQKKQLASR